MPIIDRRIKLRARRIFKRQKKQAELAVGQADDQVEKLFLKRLGRLFAVRRFVLAWAVFVLLIGFGALWQTRTLDSFYLSSRPTTGGTYREGIVGVYSNANPLFASGPVDNSVSKLIFSGLFKQAPNGNLVNDLATNLESDETGKVYTVTVRQDVQWHDGTPFSADDVVFTYKTIQNPNARSSIRSNWIGVNVQKVDDYTVRFTLPSALASFKYALTNGIVPAHKLSGIEATDLRSSTFNTLELIGTGPMKLRRIEVVGTDVESRQERIALTKNQEYHGRNVGLDGVIVRAYRSEDSMIRDFEDQVIQSMVGLNSLSDSLTSQDRVSVVSAPLTSSVMVFLNNSNEILSDVKVRQALVRGTNVTEIRKNLGFTAIPSDSPFLRSQFSYNPDITQLGYDKTKAIALLEEAGWKLNDEGIREKDGVPLRLRLVSQSLSEYAAISQQLQAEWEELGVDVEAILQPEADIQSGAIARHDYDVLLYGIAIGYDPDVFVYWHSSQADPTATSRLNLSEFQNSTADEALEGGRTRLDEELRTVKYEPFLKVWREQAPAIALYQPRFIMVVRGTFEGFAEGQLSQATDRFYSLPEWRIRNERMVK